MPNILIVEDNVSLGELYKRAMWELGANAHITTSRHDTMGYLDHEAAPDIILLDMSLPDGNGIHILKHLRDNTRFKNTQIVMITGDEMYYSYARSLNVQGYFYKPVDVGQLINHIKLLLEKQNTD